MRFDEIAKVAALIEEKQIASDLLALSQRMQALPHKRNGNTPGHRLRGLCYHMWAESSRDIMAYYHEHYKP